MILRAPTKRAYGIRSLYNDPLIVSYIGRSVDHDDAVEESKATVMVTSLDEEPKTENATTQYEDVSVEP